MIKNEEFMDILYCKWYISILDDNVKKYVWGDLMYLNWENFF